jgi:signal transduction histidine kinase
LVEKKSDRLKVAIKDNGKGISSEHLKQIFERFYQVDNLHRQGQHAGLGLAITKRIVELHGQVIAVSSQLNMGTTFSFSLPTSNIF